MKDLVFAQPNWFWGLLLLIPMIGLRTWSQIKGRDRMTGLVSPRLMGILVNGRGQSQKWTVFVLQSAAIALTFAALARPQLGFDEIEAESEGRNLIIAIDTSRSMLATDLRPDRLERAKLAATDIIRSLPEDRIGLIAFAGRPFLQAPLTVDHEAIIEAIDQMDTDIIPRGGTNIAAATQLALDTFEEAKLEQSALVLFSDGEALEGTDQVERVQEMAQKAGMSIIAVGVGTQSGAIIPELDNRGKPIPGQFVMDEDGQVVRTRLDPAALQMLASGGGVYVHLGGQVSLSRVVEQIQKEIATSRAEGDSRLRPIERFMWPLSTALAFLILTHLVPVLWIRSTSQNQRSIATLSRPAASQLILLALFMVQIPNSGLSDGDPLFGGHEAFRKGDYERAIETYENALSERVSSKEASLLQLALGAAAFRNGDFEKASEAYGQALVGSRVQHREHAHYNLGNTLFRQGESALQSMQGNDPDKPAPSLPSNEIIDSTLQQWESALEHFESALALNEENQKAAHNIEVVKRKIEELKKQQKQEQQEQEQKENENDPEQSEENQNSENNQENPPDNENRNEDSNENQESNQDEQEPDSEENEGGNSSENNGESQNPEQESPENNESETGNDQEPEQPESGDQPGKSDPQDGKLEANPNQQQPPQQANASEAAQRQVNPETGYSPSEARQLLEALADETEVRPLLAPSRGEKFKNW